MPTMVIALIWHEQVAMTLCRWCDHLASIQILDWADFGWLGLGSNEAADAAPMINLLVVLATPVQKVVCTANDLLVDMQMRRLALKPGPAECGPH